MNDGVCSEPCGKWNTPVSAAPAHAEVRKSNIGRLRSHRHKLGEPFLSRNGGGGQQRWRHRGAGALAVAFLNSAGSIAGAASLAVAFGYSAGNIAGRGRWRWRLVTRQATMG